MSHQYIDGEHGYCAQFVVGGKHCGELPDHPIHARPRDSDAELADRAVAFMQAIGIRLVPWQVNTLRAIMMHRCDDVHINWPGRGSRTR
jgi:hypothetical protein